MIFFPSAPIIDTLHLLDRIVYVVREDKCCQFPAPNFSKVRGLYKHLLSKQEIGIKVVASQDTSISRCGWGVSWVCDELGLQHINFVPKSNNLTFYQRMSKSFGGEIVGLQGTFSSAFRVLAESWLTKNDFDTAYFLPNGLSLDESITATADVVMSANDTSLFDGDIVCVSSSGTISSGILFGLQKIKAKGRLHIINSCDFKNREDKIRKRVSTKIPLSSPFFVYNLGYKYKESLLDLKVPFPCDVYLDRKAWKYLLDNIHSFKDPIVFWNIGGEWDPKHGLTGRLKGDGRVDKYDVERYLSLNRGE